MPQTIHGLCMVCATITKSCPVMSTTYIEMHLHQAMKIYAELNYKAA